MNTWVKTPQQNILHLRLEKTVQKVSFIISYSNNALQQQFDPLALNS